MSRICQLTGKKAMVGNNVSHSNRKTKRRFNANIKQKRLFIPELKLWITVKVSTQALRTMNKLGVYNFLKKQLDKGFDPFVWVDNPEKKVEAKRGYRRVEHVGPNGEKTYSISFEPEAYENQRKVQLSTIIK